MQIPAVSVLPAQGLLFGAALAFSGGAMRTSVYIDGLNLYYGAVKGTPFKWLDPVRLSALVLPQACVVDRLLYFTAHVSGAVDPDAPARQQVYLNALRTLPEVEVHFGSFLAKTVWRPVINLPVAGRAIATPQPGSNFVRCKDEHVICWHRLWWCGSRRNRRFGRARRRISRSIGVVCKANRQLGLHGGRAGTLARW